MRKHAERGEFREVKKNNPHDKRDFHTVPLSKVTEVLDSVAVCFLQNLDPDQNSMYLDPTQLLDTAKNSTVRAQHVLHCEWYLQKVEIKISQNICTVKKN